VTSTLPAPALLVDPRSLSGWADTTRAPPPLRSKGALTRARMAAGLTVTQLARRVYVSRPTVSMWESGARAAALGYWPALGRALGLCPEEVGALFVGSPPSRHDGRRLPSLAHARRRVGLTQRELAGRLGLAATTASMWESGGVPVPAQLLEQVAQILATDLDQLVAVPPSQNGGPDPRPLRHLRRCAGMSRREAAAHLRITVGTLARYEAGERATPVAVVRRMATAYGRSVGEVLQHSGQPSVPLPPGAVWRREDVPQAVRALRTAAGLTKDGLGQLLGRSGQAVRSWELGGSRPTPVSCRRMEALFQLPPGKFPTRGSTDR
jgi:transcriptional regulator with XRE-family HTH domain